MSAIEKVIEHYECIFDDVSNYVAAEEARAELANLNRERTMFIHHVLEIAKAAGYETNCEMKARQWLLSELAELRAQAAQLGPVVEALENAVRHIGELSDNVRHEEFCHECEQTLATARAAMKEKP